MRIASITSVAMICLATGMSLAEQQAGAVKKKKARDKTASAAKATAQEAPAPAAVPGVMPAPAWGWGPWAMTARSVGGVVPSSGKPVTEDTPLQAGQKIQVEYGGQWWAGEVLELLADGSVKVGYVGYGAGSDEIVPRTRLQLDASTKAETDQPLPAGFVEARLTDGSILRFQLAEERVPIASPYGALVIPAGDIQRIEFAGRIPEEVAKRVEACIKDLASANYQERENATAELLSLRDKAYPALMKKQKDATDLELNRRVEGLLAKLRQLVPEELLRARDDDVVHTQHSTITGRIAGQSFHIKTTQFGDQQLKLSDMLSLRSGKGNNIPATKTSAR